MHHALNGGQASEVEDHPQGAGDLAKPHHELFDFTPDQWLSKRFDQSQTRLLPFPNVRVRPVPTSPVVVSSKVTA